jgi:hypothetical protein
MVPFLHFIPIPDQTCTYSDFTSKPHPCGFDVSALGFSQLSERSEWDNEPPAMRVVT